MFLCFNTKILQNYWISLRCVACVFLRACCQDFLLCTQKTLLVFCVSSKARLTLQHGIRLFYGVQSRRGRCTRRWWRCRIIDTRGVVAIANAQHSLIQFSTQHTCTALSSCTDCHGRGVRSWLAQASEITIDILPVESPPGKSDEYEHSYSLVPSVYRFPPFMYSRSHQSWVIFDLYIRVIIFYFVHIPLRVNNQHTFHSQTSQLNAIHHNIWPHQFYI